MRNGQNEDLTYQFLIYFPVHKIFKKNDFTEGIVILLTLHHKEAL